MNENTEPNLSKAQFWTGFSTILYSIVWWRLTITILFFLVIGIYIMTGITSLGNWFWEDVFVAFWASLGFAITHSIHWKSEQELHQIQRFQGNRISFSQRVQVYNKAFLKGFGVIAIAPLGFLLIFLGIYLLYTSFNNYLFGLELINNYNLTLVINGLIITLASFVLLPLGSFEIFKGIYRIGYLTYKDYLKFILNNLKSFVVSYVVLALVVLAIPVGLRTLLINFSSLSSVDIVYYSLLALVSLLVVYYTNLQLVILNLYKERLVENKILDLDNPNL